MDKNNGKKGKDVKDILGDVRRNEVSGENQYPKGLYKARRNWFLGLLELMGQGLGWMIKFFIGRGKK